jgi:hypothetical protein
MVRYHLYSPLTIDPEALSMKNDAIMSQIRVLTHAALSNRLDTIGADPNIEVWTFFSQTH